MRTPMNTASWPTSPSIRPASCFPMIILSPIRSSTRFRTVWRRRGFLNSTRTAPADGRLKPCWRTMWTLCRPSK
ncbi:Phage holin, partial [Dysosmobacter welbionis]